MALLTPVSTPGPRRVVRVDLDAPLPELVADDRGVTALVVGYRDGHPVTTLDVALTDDPADAGRAIAALAAGPAGSPVGSSDGLHAGSSVVPTGSTAGTSAVPDAALPSVSVVVSTIVTRLADIARLLDHLAALDYPSYEVVVVDNRVAVPAEDPLPGLLAGTTCDSSSSVARAVPPDGTPVSRRPRARSSPSRTTTSASTRGGSG